MTRSTRLKSLGGPDPVDVHVGRRLKQLRKDRGISQQVLAAAVGVTFQQLQKYEGATNRVSASMLYGLARALALPMAAFFEGLPDPAQATAITQPERKQQPNKSALGT